MADNGATKQMSKTERQTLIRLVRQRFKLLETGLAARRAQLERVVQHEVIEETKDEAEEYRQRVLTEVLDPLTDLQARMDEIIGEARDAGFERQGYSWRSLENALSDTKRERADGSFVPRDLHQKVQRRMLERLGDRPMSKYALELEESRLVEELLVGDLASEDARDFLARVPTLDGMIPLPNGGANRALLMAEASEE